MALGKPVIANDAGGTKEVVRHNVNGYLITTETNETIADMLIDLIDDRDKRAEFGKNSCEIVKSIFTLEKMGNAFEKLYCELFPENSTYPDEY
jgi:glycosyltransferase involved in cell wall biosynthesis